MNVDTTCGSEPPIPSDLIFTGESFLNSYLSIVLSTRTAMLQSKEYVRRCYRQNITSQAALSDAGCAEYVVPAMAPDTSPRAYAR